MTATAPPNATDFAVIDRPSHAGLRPGELAPPGPHELLIRLEGCGVCASNLPVDEGRDWFEYPQPPGAPGHESWGRVITAGAAVRNFAVGDRVASLDERAHASDECVAASPAVRLPPALERQPCPGETLGRIRNIRARSDSRAGQTVAIVGAGFLGLGLMQLAVAAGARVLALNRTPHSLALAQQFGAEPPAMDDQWQRLEAVRRRTEGDFCERVIEAIGARWLLDLAGGLTGIGGRPIIAGYHQDKLQQVNMQRWNWRGIDVVNAHKGEMAMRLDGVRRAVEAVVSGRLQTEALMARQLAALRAELAGNGRERILARHTCAHRVDELPAILARRRLPAAGTVKRSIA